MLARRTFVLGILAAAVALLVDARAPATAQSPQPQLNLDGKGVLLKGYDPVAYFTAGQPTRGSDQITATHNGATFHFANAANRDAFLKEPAKYLPEFGGFCAYGVASGYKVDADPTVWKIVDGKLYVNYNRSVGRKFGADTATFIKQANEKWPSLKEKPVK